MPVTLCFSLDPLHSFCTTKPQGKATRVDKYLEQALEQSSAGDELAIEPERQAQRARVNVVSCSHDSAPPPNPMPNERVNLAARAKQDILFTISDRETDLT